MAAMPCRSPTPSPVMPEPCPPCGCPAERSRNPWSEVSFAVLSWPAASVSGCYSNPLAVTLPYRCCNIAKPLVTYCFLLLFYGCYTCYTYISICVRVRARARTRGRSSDTAVTAVTFDSFPRLTWGFSVTAAGCRCNSCRNIAAFPCSDQVFWVLHLAVTPG